MEMSVQNIQARGFRNSSESSEEELAIQWLLSEVDRYKLENEKLSRKNEELGKSLTQAAEVITKQDKLIVGFKIKWKYYQEEYEKEKRKQRTSVENKVESNTDVDKKDDMPLETDFRNRETNAPKVENKFAMETDSVNKSTSNPRDLTVREQPETKDTSVVTHGVKRRDPRYPKVKCFCGFTTKSMSTLNKHINRKNYGLLFACDICQQRFPANWFLKQHYKKEHNVNKQFKGVSCHRCGQRFKNKSVQTRHLNESKLSGQCKMKTKK